MSEFKRPCILVPTNSSSLERIYRNEFESADFYSYCFERSELYQIFSSGFFEQLNSRYNLMISDFEEEYIADTDILREILSYDLKAYSKKIDKGFLKKLKLYLEYAINSNTALILLF